MLFIHQYIPRYQYILNKLRDIYIPYNSIFVLANILPDDWQASAMAKLKKKKVSLHLLEGIPDNFKLTGECVSFTRVLEVKHFQYKMEWAYF